jgi:hypothetical protein
MGCEDISGRRKAKASNCGMASGSAVRPLYEAESKVPIQPDLEYSALQAAGNVKQTSGLFRDVVVEI